MNFSVPSRYAPVLQHNHVPSHYRPYRMPGARSLYVKGRFGDYLKQSIITDGCSMQLNLFRVITETLLHPSAPDAVLPLHFMLKGNIRCLLKGFGEAWLMQKRYNLFYVPGGIRHDAWFKPGFYKSFHIDFSPGYLFRLAAGYRELREVVNLLKRNSDRGVQQHTAHITPQIEEMVKDCTTLCPVDEPDKGAFMEVRSKELLLKYVQDRPVDKAVWSHRGIRIIEDIMDHVSAHLDYPHSIRSLAHTFGLSEMTLKRRFKAYTGQSVFEFITNKRMAEASHLLIHTVKPVRDIAMAVGYGELSNFDRAFKRKFGIAPLEYREMNGGPSL